MEHFSDFVDATSLNVFQCTRNKHEAFLEQENDATEIEIRETVDGLFENEDPAQKAVLLEDMPQIRSLNDKQRKIIEFLSSWLG